MRECPEPNVRKKFAIGGKCTVSYWVCKQCKYRKEFENHGGLGCDYGKDKNA